MLKALLTLDKLNETGKKYTNKYSPKVGGKIGLKITIGKGKGSWDRLGSRWRGPTRAVTIRLVFLLTSRHVEARQIEGQATPKLLAITLINFSQYGPDVTNIVTGCHYGKTSGRMIITIIEAMDTGLSHPIRWTINFIYQTQAIGGRRCPDKIFLSWPKPSRLVISA